MAVVIGFAMKLHKNNLKLFGTAMVCPVFATKFYLNYTKPTEIFDDIPPLSSPKIEKERLRIVRMCMPVDFKLAVRAVSEENDFNS